MLTALIGKNATMKPSSASLSVACPSHAALQHTHQDMDMNLFVNLFVITCLMRGSRAHQSLQENEGNWKEELRTILAERPQQSTLLITTLMRGDPRAPKPTRR